MPLPTLLVKNGAGADVTVSTPASGRQAATDSQAVVLSAEDLAALGVPAEAPPVDDTAPAGLNGRLQRLAQRLTAMLARLPAAIGIRSASDSLSVVLAQDHAALPLPVGAATAAAQAAQAATLTSIDGRLAGSLAVTGSFFQATQPVSAASLPLPSGAATSAAQATTNATLSAIDGKLPAAVIPGLLPVDTLATVGLARQLAAGSASANTALTASARRISIFARLADVRYAIGTGAQTAHSSSHYIAVGERLDLDIPASAQIAVIRAGSVDGVLEVSELGA